MKWNPKDQITMFDLLESSVDSKKIKTNEVEQLKHIVFYSGGLGSWMTTKRVIERHGKENVIMLFTDTKMEDEDLYRFLDDTEKDFGIPITRIADGRDVWEVFKDVKFIGNSRIAQCSHILKQKESAKWLKENYQPDECILYLGIDWTEEHRRAAPTKNWAPYTVEFPMCDAPYMNKVDVIKELESKGIALPRLYKKGFSHNNCFQGDETFITSKGIKKFKEMAGQKTKVLGTSGGWKDAKIKSFGEQELVKLTVQRYSDVKEIFTTKDHRWFVRSGRTKRIEKKTHELKIGQPLFSMYSSLGSNVKLSPFAIAQGIVFGDGSKSYTTDAPVSLTLCGEKDAQLLRWFPNSDIKKVEGIGLKVSDLPRTWKDIPDIEESKSFLYGWLAGYFAADGTVKRRGDVKLSSAKLEHLEFVKDVCIRLGIGTNKIRTENRKGYNDHKTALYSITLINETLREDFFLIKEQRERFLSREKKRSAEWKVVSTEETGRVEEVYCAVVPEGHAFTLEDNIFTGNCGGFCVRAGQGHFIHLLKEMPERYAYHEGKEEEMRQYLGRDDVSILKRTRKGVQERLTLKQLREEYENGSQQIDMFDIGGCGCFVDGD